MPITTEWLVENRVMLSTYWGEVTIEDAKESSVAANILAESAPPGVMVHLLINILPGENNISIMDQARMKLQKPHNLGWVVAVTRRNALLNMLTSALGHIVGLRMRQVHTFEEALAMLQELDETLPDLAVYREKGLG